MAFGDVEVKFHEPVELSSIGPDQGRFADIKNNFNTAWNPGIAFQPQGPKMESAIDVAPEIRQPDPNDLWANTGPQRSPVLDDVDNAGITLAHADMSTKGMKMGDGASYLGAQTMQAATELLGALTKPSPEPEPILPQQQMGMNMAFRPGGLFS